MPFYMCDIFISFLCACIVLLLRALFPQMFPHRRKCSLLQPVIYLSSFYLFQHLFILILIRTDCHQQWRIYNLGQKLDGTPCDVAEKRLLLHPLPLFNVTVMLSLSKTLTYMLTYNIDLGDGGR